MEEGDRKLLGFNLKGIKWERYMLYHVVGVLRHVLGLKEAVVDESVLHAKSE